MTERSRIVMITLADEVREDDFDDFLRGVFMSIKGVQDVELLTGEQSPDPLAVTLARGDISKAVNQALWGEGGALR